MTRSKEEFETVLGFIAEGRNDCEISRLTGIPRETVRDWRWGKSKRTVRNPQDRYCPGDHDFSTLPSARYTYLLGMYLGDGYICESSRGVFRLRIFNDAQYTEIIEECCGAMEAVMPGKHAHQLLRRHSRCIEISMYSRHWPCLFPQHGPGRKHERLIKLEAWQSEFVMRNHESFLRGLMHSDGCRVIANDRGVESIRYHFSNRSEDIKGLFCASLDSLGIPWTRPSDKEIAVYRKAAVARLDEFIGPKK